MTVDITKFSSLGIEKIKNSSILENEDFSNMKNITKELQRSFEVKQQWRTETEIRYSVLNDVKFPTPASKYWQSIREQMVFYENLIQLSFQYKRDQIKLERLERDLLKTTDDLDRRSIEVDIDEVKFGLMVQRLQAHDRVREILIWEKVKEECKKLQDFDINDVNSHQKESYKLRWEREKQISAITQNPSLFKASASNLKTLLDDIKSLPEYETENITQ